jgi:tRNA(adenine34) deaminase
MRATAIDRAILLAKKARDQGEFPVGAVVYRDEHILGEGFNQKESTKDPSTHAEVMAIRVAAQAVGDWRLTGGTLVTTLEPCPMCLGAALQARIHTIIYLAKDFRWGACGSVMDFSNHAQLNHRCVCHYEPYPDVVSLMTDFFKDIGKR